MYNVHTCKFSKILSIKQVKAAPEVGAAAGGYSLRTYFFTLNSSHLSP